MTRIRMILVQTLVVALVVGGGVAHAGSITGKIVFEGDPPKMKEIQMDADPVCASKHKEPLHNEALVLGEGQTMANIFVRVIKGLPEGKEYPIPTEPVVLNQEGCQFSPHVFGVRAGQSIDVLNPDGTLHNVNTLCKVNTGFNIAMPKFKKKLTKVFEEPEDMFPIQCNVHPWMMAYCVVMEHPFFDVTEKDGKFKIEGLDPGTYEIEARHEKLGTKTATVTIEGDEAQTADFTFALKKRKK